MCDEKILTFLGKKVVHVHNISSEGAGDARDYIHTDISDVYTWYNMYMHFRNHTFFNDGGITDGNVGKYLYRISSVRSPTSKGGFPGFSPDSVHTYPVSEIGSCKCGLSACSRSWHANGYVRQ